ncbi:MAG: hypothetical protein WBS22_07755, partial [Methylocystis sp.]
GLGSGLAGGGGGYGGGHGQGGFGASSSNALGGESFIANDVTQLTGLVDGSPHNPGNGKVDIELEQAAPGPVPGAGLLSLVFIVLAGVWTKARGFLAR